MQNGTHHPHARRNPNSVQTLTTCQFLFSPTLSSIGTTVCYNFNFLHNDSLSVLRLILYSTVLLLRLINDERQSNIQISIYRTPTPTPTPGLYSMEVGPYARDICKGNFSLSTRSSICFLYFSHTPAAGVCVFPFRLFLVKTLRTVRTQQFQHMSSPIATLLQLLCTTNAPYAPPQHESFNTLATILSLSATA
jgi:hypothetical protein